MKTVLVTGGAGFIGSHLCEKLLESGCKVICLDNFNSFYDPVVKRGNILKALESPHYTLVEGDIRNCSLLSDIINSAGISTVVHLAALAGVRKSLESPLDYVDIDIKGTVGILEACRRNGVKKFVFASSSSVYGPASVPFREEDATDLQLSPYAAAKRSGEIFCKTYSYLYGIPVVCLRFFTVYGPRQRPEMAISSFTGKIDRGMEIVLFGDGSSSRDYTYIDDITDGITAAMDLECGFEIFNLGNSNPVSLNRVVELLELHLGKRANKTYIPALPEDPSSTWASIEKAGKMLGFKPKVSFEEGIARYVDWYRQMEGYP